MQYDLTQVRLSIQSYRRRFCAKWQEVYGEPFQHSVLRAKQMSKYKPIHFIQDFFEGYADRIRNVKKLIEQE